eukprot:Selendium_serpulae@DN6258_c0_g1_i2.p1
MSCTHVKDNMTEDQTLPTLTMPISVSPSTQQSRKSLYCESPSYQGKYVASSPLWRAVPPRSAYEAKYVGSPSSNYRPAAPQPRQVTPSPIAPPLEGFDYYSSDRPKIENCDHRREQHQPARPLAQRRRDSETPQRQPRSSNCSVSVSPNSKARPRASQIVCASPLPPLPPSSNRRASDGNRRQRRYSHQCTPQSVNPRSTPTPARQTVAEQDRFTNDDQGKHNNPPESFVEHTDDVSGPSRLNKQHSKPKIETPPVFYSKPKPVTTPAPNVRSPRTEGDDMRRRGKESLRPSPSQVAAQRRTVTKQSNKVDPYRHHQRQRRSDDGAVIRVSDDKFVQNKTHRMVEKTASSSRQPGSPLSRSTSSSSVWTKTTRATSNDGPTSSTTLFSEDHRRFSTKRGKEYDESTTCIDAGSTVFEGDGGRHDDVATVKNDGDNDSSRFVQTNNYDKCQSQASYLRCSVVQPIARGQGGEPIKPRMMHPEDKHRYDEKQYPHEFQQHKQQNAFENRGLRNDENWVSSNIGSLAVIDTSRVQVKNQRQSYEDYDLRLKQQQSQEKNSIPCDQSGRQTHNHNRSESRKNNRDNYDDHRHYNLRESRHERVTPSNVVSSSSNRSRSRELRRAKEERLGTSPVVSHSQRDRSSTTPQHSVGPQHVSSSSSSSSASASAAPRLSSAPSRGSQQSSPRPSPPLRRRRGPQSQSSPCSAPSSPTSSPY